MCRVAVLAGDSRDCSRQGSAMSTATSLGTATSTRALGRDTILGDLALARRQHAADVKDGNTCADIHNATADKGYACHRQFLSAETNSNCSSAFPHTGTNAN
eukprot:1094965-Amphidinium_carterae.1